MKSIVKYTILSVFILLFQEVLKAQPANDNCENAYQIVIPNGGFDYGTYISSKSFVDQAGKQKGEQCANELAENGNCDKTVWYKFYIPTTRNISVQLTQQDSAIPQIFAGFNVYKVKNCNYTEGDLALNLSPLNKFGESGNTCLQQGWYYIQVGSKQRAAGEIWIELTTAAPYAQNYDQFDAPYNFGLIKDKNINYNFNFNCAAVSRPELNAIGDSSYNKSIFITYTLPANASYNSVDGYYTGYKYRVKYRIFKDTITADSVNSNKPFMWCNDKMRFFPIREFCPPYSSVNQKYYLQVVVNSNEEQSAYLWLTIANNSNIVDLWNTPNTNDIITTNNNFTRSIRHYYNCDGLLKNHSCKQVIPKEFYNIKTVSNTIYFIDTFNMAGYTVIKVTESGTLTVITRDPLLWAMTMRYALYKGDITQGCNLTFMHEESAQTFNACVEPGVYTLLTLTQNDVYNVYVNHTISQKATVLNTIHNYPKDPEMMGDFTPSSRTLKYSKNINYQMSRDTTLTIDTLTLKGFFIYREFRLTEKATIIISEANYNISHLYLVKGRISKDNVSLLNGHTYNNGSYYQTNSCQILDTGYYTIISRLDTSKKTKPCVAPYSSLTIQYVIMCQANNYQTPSTPYKINNNNSVFASAANLKNIDYVYTLPLCTDCNTNNPIVPAVLFLKKRFIYDQTKYSFTTFYMGQNGEFRLPALNYTNFELYKGDCVTNPSLVQDTNNIVSSCFDGNVYCNLEGGKYYTLVTFNVNYVLAYFTPHYQPINDFAATAYDVGHFNSNTNRTTPAIPITCHINGFTSDPCSYESGIKRCTRYALPNELIGYKDTLNFKRRYGRKTLWYTFTADMSSTITLQVSANTALYKNPKMNVFKFNGPYTANFATMVANGFDSTEKTLEWVATNVGNVNSNSENRVNYTSFENFGCAPSRYFVILEDEYEYDKAHYEYKIKVTYQQTNKSNKGDFCSNAIADSLNTYGTKNLSVNNTCHTYGNSPYESPEYTVKSSWFRFKVSGLNSCDIKIKCTAGDGLLYYNVYGGSCQIMTRVSRLADLYSYFTLSCMGPGNYYIQAVCKSSKNATIAFEVNTLLPENPNCKPYDFRMPIAQFEIKGGCKNDTIRFQNMSSKGPGISYSWYINNTLFSNTEEPYLLLSNPLVLLNNTIRLNVTNTVDNLTDMISKTYTKDTNNYKFKITGPPQILCGDTAILKVATNFPYKINYTWTDNQTPTVIYTPERIATNRYTSYMYYVKGKSDNCFFSDSFLLKAVNYMDRYRDTSICAGQGYTIYAKAQDYFYITSSTINLQVIDSVTITKTGIYYLRYTYRSCTIYDTLNIELDTGHTTMYINDSVFTCNNAFVTLKYKGKLRSYLWSNGKTTESIMTNKAGTYVLKGAISDCKDLEYKVNVKTTIAALDPLTNMVLCKGDTFIFKPNYSGFAITSKTPQADTTIIQKTFQAKITMKNGYCIITDSAMIYMSKPVFRVKDTLFCSYDQSFTITLDAGPAKWYYWLHDQSIGRTADVYNYGIYKVATQTNTCVDTTTFAIKEDCGVRTFIPNAFSPNNDGANEGFGPILFGQYTRFTMCIFNRWGEILFITDNSQNWDGKYKEEYVQQSVYGYMIVVKDYYNRETIYNGTVTVLR
ncbi:MAG: T9SS type B sorting domain-containing protein [Bacteroidota bacterium]